MTYIESDSGLVSFHFKSPLSVEFLSNDLDAMLPSNSYLQFDLASNELNDGAFTNDNGTTIDEKLYFKNSNWNEATNTFTGVIDLRPSSYNRACSWWITLVFSDDLTRIDSEFIEAKDAKLITLFTADFSGDSDTFELVIPSIQD